MWTEPEELGPGKGPPVIGVLKLAYTSDPKFGCAAVWDARRELTMYRYFPASLPPCLPDTDSDGNNDD